MFTPFLQASKGTRKKSGQKSASAQQNDIAEAQATSAQPAGASSVSSGVKLENVRLTMHTEFQKFLGLRPCLGVGFNCCATAFMLTVNFAAMPIDGALLLGASQLHCPIMWGAAGQALQCTIMWAPLPRALQCLSCCALAHCMLSLPCPLPAHSCLWTGVCTIRQAPLQTLQEELHAEQLLVAHEGIARHMASPSSNAVQIAITFKNQQVLKDVSWDVKKGERVGLVGINGAGKTTQLQIITGALAPDSGNIVKVRHNMRIAYLTQDFDVTKTNTVREEFMAVYKEQAEVRVALPFVFIV